MTDSEREALMSRNRRTRGYLMTLKWHRETKGDDMEVPDPEKMTCIDCPQAVACRSAWDYYNTNGDCLEDK